MQRDAQAGWGILSCSPNSARLQVLPARPAEHNLRSMAQDLRHKVPNKVWKIKRLDLLWPCPRVSRTSNARLTCSGNRIFQLCLSTSNKFITFSCFPKIPYIYVAIPESPSLSIFRLFNPDTANMHLEIAGDHIQKNKKGEKENMYVEDNS